MRRSVLGLPPCDENSVSLRYSSRKLRSDPEMTHTSWMPLPHPRLSRARLQRGTHPMKSWKLSGGPVVAGQCLCGAVQFEMEYPAFWAWHDHSRASRIAHGAVYATYVGTWRKRFRITAGEREINRFEEKETGAVRSFCRRCGTPLIYER